MMSLFDRRQAVGDEKVYDCSPEAVTLLAALETAKSELMTAKTALADANNAVEKLSRRFALEISKDGDADAWDNAVTGQLNAQRALEDKQMMLEKAKEPLSASYQLIWPSKRLPTSSELLFAEHFTDDNELRNPWADLIVARPLVGPVFGEIDVTERCSEKEGNSPLTCLSSHLDLVLHFVSDWPQPEARRNAQMRDDHHRRQGQTLITDAAYVSAVETKDKTLDGLLYREPARGGVVICLKKDANASTCGNDPLVKPEMVNFPQFGQLRFIPFRVLPFQGKDQSIEFTADGYPSKITLKSTKAVGAEALGAASDAVTTVADALEKREEERRSDAKAARDQAVAELTTELDLLEKEAKIAERKAPPSKPSESSLLLAELQADIEMKRAKLLQLLLTEGITTGAIDPVVLFGAGG